MAETPAPLTEKFSRSREDNIIAAEDLAAILGMPTAFAKLLASYQREEIAVKSEKDPVYSRLTAQESLVFVPQAADDNSEAATYKDFWLHVHIKGAHKNPVMKLKFADLGSGRFEMSSPLMETIYRRGTLYYRPVLGHETIGNVEILIHNAFNKPLKVDPPMPRVPDRLRRSPE